MKRRIIGMILVVVMLTLSLVSCGYSLKDDDMSKYATLSEEDKASLLKALENVVIEDGDFTTDPETRKNKVIDYIYKNIMATVADTAQKTEGVPGAHDKVYYAYYTTADFDGTIATLEVANLKAPSSNLILGASEYDTKVLEQIAAKLATVDFKDNVYKSVTSGTVEAGKYAYVSYSYSYKDTAAEGQPEKSGKVVNKVFVVGAAPAEGASATCIEDYITGKKIGSKLDKVTFKNSAGNDVTYSDITVNWTSNVVSDFTFTDTTYTESKTFTDTENVTRDVKDKVLTYHVFPVYYLVTPEYNATNLIDLYYKNELTVDALYAIILGSEYASLDEKEDAEKIEERAELLKDYKTSAGDSLDAFVGKLVDLYKDVEDADEARNNASTSEAQKTFDEANNKLNEEKNKENPDADEVNRLQEIYNKAEENLKKAEEAQAAAHKSYENKVAEKNEYIQSLLTVAVNNETVDAVIERRYREETYKILQKSYNETIRMNLAREVYHLITKYVKLTGTLPEKAVEMTYESLWENYETEFYTGSYSDSVSNYKQYKTFDAFLIKQVTDDYKSVKTVAEAKAALKEGAAEYVKPLVQLYLVAEVFDLKVTDEEFKEYKKDPANQYDYNVYTYGENSVLHAYQLDKILDYFVEYEDNEDEPVKDANGYDVITYTFKKIAKYEFGTPASEAKEDTAE